MQPYVNTIKLRSTIDYLLQNFFLLKILDQYCVEEVIRISTFIDQDPAYKLREFSFIIYKSSIKETEEFYTILAREIIQAIKLEVSLKYSYKIEVEYLDKYIILTIHNKFS